MTEKIQKLLSHFGWGSRRYIERMIKSEKVLINEKKIVIGQRLNREDLIKVEIEGKSFFLKQVRLKSRVLVYNKPEGEICTRNDFKKRRTVFDKLPVSYMNRWISIGRLDINTKGLLLFTNDGNLANALMHPKNKIEREYYIRVFGVINKNTINILKNGVKIKDGYASFNKIEPFLNKESGKNQWFKGILCEGRNREIRSMLKSVKCEVSRLIRIRYGNIFLPKHLKSGQWVELNSELLNNLYNLVSLKNNNIKLK